jgi:hypothetical protein
VTQTIPLTAMPLLHHTRSVRRASGFVQTRKQESEIGRGEPDVEGSQPRYASISEAIIAWPRESEWRLVYGRPLHAL